MGILKYPEEFARKPWIEGRVTSKPDGEISCSHSQHDDGLMVANVAYWASTCTKKLPHEWNETAETTRGSQRSKAETINMKNNNHEYD